MIPSRFAAYFWAGLDVLNALVPGLRRLQEAGFVSTARIVMSPVRTHDDDIYHFDQEFADQVAGVPFLPAAVRSTQYQKAFALPSLHTFVLTANDSASFDHLFAADGSGPAWLEANADLVRDEYREMTVALYETQKWTGKRFIVCFWEGDSVLYWPVLVPPFTVPSFPQPVVIPGGLRDPPSSVVDFRYRALKRWCQLRQEGIKHGRIIARSKGWGGIEVNDAIEFNSLYYRKEERKCHPQNGFLIRDTLHDIIRVVHPDYASYSAWESTYRGRLFDDIQTIRQFLQRETNGHTQLIIGELGVTGHSDPSKPTPKDSLYSKSWQYIQSAHAANRAKIPVIVLWKAWDPFNIFEGEGLFNADGTERQILKNLQASFRSPVPSFESPIKISGVLDQFDMNGSRSADGKRYFEVYGNFPGTREGNADVPGWMGGYRAIINFSTRSFLDIPTWGESGGQINIGLVPIPRAVVWFLLQFRRLVDNKLSNRYGPIRLNRIPPRSTKCLDLVTQRYWAYYGS